MLQVQLHDVVINSLRRVENDGADGRFRPPLEIARAFFRRGTQRIERDGPRRVSAVANIEVGKNKASGRVRRGGRLLQRFSAEQFERTGKRVTKLILVESNPLGSVIDAVAENVNLLLQFLTLAGCFEFFIDSRQFF